jgi:hypothetical protein
LGKHHREGAEWYLGGSMFTTICFRRFT